MLRLGADSALPAVGRIWRPAQQESKLPYPSIVALDDAGVPKVDAFLPYGGIRIEDNVCVGRMGRRI